MIAEKRIGSLLVLEAGEMVGIVTETDMVRKVIAARLPASSISAGAVTNDPLVQIDIIHTVFMTVRREIARKRVPRYSRETRETCEKSGRGRKFHLRESRLSRTSCLSRSRFTNDASRARAVDP
jgi:hypothetical protein